MTANGTNGSTWKIVSRSVGILIALAVLCLLFFSAITRRPVDWFTADLLIVLAAYLLGAPSLASFFSTLFGQRRNGNGSP